MCGITGLLALNPEADRRLSKIKQSTDKLFLRGPDSGNVYTDERCALGHRRLSIIDTSHGADQPMTDHTGRYVIIFNGEIFNFRQLSREYLTGVWPSFAGPKTQSDTEVLLYLLIHHGTECLGWLSGFFAFAFYDRATGSLLLARDRFGKKPLLYYYDADYFAFASEMKALLQWDIPRELDYNALHTYLQLNYVPQPRSMIKEVNKLEPGHYISIHKEGRPEEKPYYTLEIKPGRYGELSYEEAKEGLVSRLDNSVRERMLADVPLGAFLSGGIDSSIIVSLASRYTDQLNTFSIGYRDHPFFDETHYARLVATKYKTNHTVFSLGNEDFLEHVHDVLDYLDEPFADSSAIPVYILSKHTRKHVTVALSGDGGDEIFAGYNKHAAEWKIRQKSILNTLVSAGLPLWTALPKSRSNRVTNMFRQLHRFAEGSQLGLQERYWRWAAYNDDEAATNLLHPAARVRTNDNLLGEQKAHLLSGLKNGDFNEVLLTDMRLVLLSDMLVKVDLMSMANSLEVRSPFLDYQVVDFAFGLPASYKIDGHLKKKIVQDAFRHLLPEELYNRPKHGFEIPLLDWFRKELWSLINDDLLQKDFVSDQQLFNVDATEGLKKKLRSSNPGDSHATIWALIVFQHWWKKYFNS